MHRNTLQPRPIGERELGQEREAEAVLNEICDIGDVVGLEPQPAASSALTWSPGEIARL
jgi:hypothetical protein